MRGVLALLSLLGRWLPLPLLRAVGVLLGWLLHALLSSRRKVVRVNLAWCFPDWDAKRRRRIERQVFVRFAQSWLDRGWLWTASEPVLQRRLRLCGNTEVFAGKAPLVLFSPHFMGLDAGWTALTLLHPHRRFCTIYAQQQNPQADAWVRTGRERFGQPRLVPRLGEVRSLVQAVRSGEPLYLLPDMNYDPSESLWVPFYGVIAATIPSLSRFARLGHARVVPVVSRMTDQGYDIEIMPAWDDVPGVDLERDTRCMNERLQSWIDTMPDQYYWVHKRFKDRPDGGAAPY